jgi:competence protein ComEC
VIKPQLAVISVGKNSYGHPTPEAIKQLTNIGAKILRTDKNGEIEITSDGKSWEVK